MECNDIFLRKRITVIFTVMTFLIAIAFVPTYASSQEKAVQGIIEHISNDNNNITVNGQSYNISNALIISNKERKMKKIELELGLKVTVYLDGGIGKKVIVFDKNIVE